MARYVDDVDDLLAKFKIAEVDDAAFPKYYGFAAPDGSWYVLRETTAPATFRYSRGDSGFATNWTGRGSLVFDYIFNVF